MREASRIEERGDMNRMVGRLAGRLAHREWCGLAVSMS